MIAQSNSANFWLEKVFLWRVRNKWDLTKQNVTERRDNWAILLIKYHPFKEYVRFFGIKYFINVCTTSCAEWSTNRGKNEHSSCILVPNSSKTIHRAWPSVSGPLTNHDNSKKIIIPSLSITATWFPTHWSWKYYSCLECCCEHARNFVVIHSFRVFVIDFSDRKYRQGTE